jgi:tungstate transport system ATP-binding protein
MLELTDLLVEKRSQPVCQLSHLVVKAGDRLMITGENGAGKSTLLRVIAGLEPKFSGRLNSNWPLQQRVYVHQNPVMFQGSVQRNVSFGLKARGMSTAHRLKKTIAVMEQLNCRHLLTADANRLSAGERRRVALARAIIIAPALLLLDEPFAELDAGGVDVVGQTLATLDAAVVIASPVCIPSAIQASTLVLQKPA